jgi:hypothetical protein
MYSFHTFAGFKMYISTRFRITNGIKEMRFYISRRQFHILLWGSAPVFTI